MAGIETVSAVISLLDICITRGKQVYQICKTFSNAEKELAERELRVRTNWIRIRHQLESISREMMCNMKAELVNNFRDVLETLAAKLSKVLRRLSDLSPSSNSNEDIQRPPTRRLSDQFFKRFRYVTVKESLDTAIQELETWRRLFDPSWFLLIKATSPTLLSEASRYAGRPSAASISLSGSSADVEEARQKIFLTASELEREEIVDKHLSFSKVAVGMRKRTQYILDPMQRPDGADAITFPRHLRTLAQQLSSIDPITSHLLSCKGIIKDEARYTMVFRIPEGLQDPHSLRSLLGEAPIPLTERFRIAKDLANSISDFHAYGYVHKDIRPETVWILRHQDQRTTFTFLLGFERFRHEDGRTGTFGDQHWEKNLYRHVQRRGTSPQVLYQMQHDIYSLGVCLLEIGLWESFVTYATGRPEPKKRLSSDRAADTRATEFHEEGFLEMARDILPFTVGDVYSQVVQTCLTCLNEDNMDFGNAKALEDEDGILVGVRYIQKILGRLGEIQI